LHSHLPFLSFSVAFLQVFLPIIAAIYRPQQKRTSQKPGLGKNLKNKEL